jgi:hypothetical protein
VNEKSERVELIVFALQFSTIEFLLLEKLLAFPLNRKYKISFEEAFYDKHHYFLEIENTHKVNPRIILAAFELGIKITHKDNLLTFEANEIQFNDFIQQVFILLFCHISQHDDYLISEKVINRIRRYTRKWLKKLSPNSKAYFKKTIKVPKNNFIKFLRENNKPKIKKLNCIEEVVDLINSLNISSMIDIGIANNGIICYAIAHYNKHIQVTGISEDNNKVIVARQAKPTYKGKVLDGAYYKNLVFIQANPLLPIICNYAPVDLLVISDGNTEGLENVINDYYKPRYIIAITDDKVTLTELEQNNSLSKWQKFYEEFTKDDPYKIRAINEGLCHLNTFNGDFQKLYEESLENYRQRRLNV